MKDFLVIGNQNAVFAVNVFKLISDNKVFLGFAKNRGMYYYVPDSYEYGSTYRFEREKDGKKAMRVPSACWFTSLPVNKDFIILEEKYAPEKYPKYDNYDAINCDRVAKIPYDYDGVIGVPITFIYKYCPEQFEIVGSLRPLINGKLVYARILIKRRQSAD